MSIADPIWIKEKLLVLIREAIQKDTERSLGVLQAKGHILTRPSRFMSIENMGNIIRCTIILQNMCVEERQEFGVGYLLDNDERGFSRRWRFTYVMWASASTPDVAS